MSALSVAFGKVGPFFAGLWARVAPALVFAGAILLALLGVYAVARRSGRDAERSDQLQAGMGSIAKANQAAQNLDHSSQAVANDPDNLDRVH